MTLFGPRVGKQRPDFLKPDAGRQRMQKFPGLSAHKVAVGQARPLGFPAAFAEAFVPQINAHAEFVGEFGGIVRKKMTVSAADFPDEAAGRRQERSEFGAQRGAPLGDVLDESGFIVHAFNWREPARWRNLEASAFPEARQTHNNGQSGALGVFRPDPALVQLDNMLYDAEAQARATSLARAPLLHPVKPLVDVRQVFRRDACAIVADKTLDLVLAGSACAEFDARALGGVFQCVVE